MTRDEAKQIVLDALAVSIPTELGPAWNAGFDAGYDARESVRCIWREDPDEDMSGIWHTDCGESFEIHVGGPDANGLRFCCFCGKLLLEGARR